MQIKLMNLTRSYHGKPALKDVGCELAPGGNYLLLGPNGSGKTTLMKLIAGLTSPSAGEIRLDGARMLPADKARIAYMPTENYFYSYMSVRDAGRYYADFFADFDAAGYADMIERAELEPQARVRALSSGMSAKLRLALTLSRNAPVMMFDEPINGVDMLTRDWVLSEIAARRGPERTMLISTHLVEQAEQIADHALFLRRGELVRSGELSELCGARTLEDLYREIYAPKGAGEAQTHA